MSINNGGHYVTTLMHHSTKTDLLADNHGFSRVEITWASVINYARRWASENLDVNMDVVTFRFRKYGEDRVFHLSIELNKDGTLSEYRDRDVNYYSRY